MPPKKKKPGSSKSRERKLKRKQEQEEVAVALEVIKAAYQHVDLMESLPAFKSFKRNSLDLTVSCCQVAKMSPEDLKWAFDLMKSSVKSYYESGGWGWNDRKKWEELTHDSACFLLARESHSRQLQGFINFRFDLEEQTEVVYCYEVHLSPEVRRKGLGRFLVQILELIGFRVKMKKVVLTIFKENTISNSFFREKMNYVDDETSQVYCDPLHSEDYSYSILSKSLVKKHSEGPLPVARAVSEMEYSQGTAHKALHNSGGPLGEAEPQAKPSSNPMSEESVNTTLACNVGLCADREESCVKSAQTSV